MWVDELIKIIKSQQLHIDTIQLFLVNIIDGDEGKSLPQEDMRSLLLFLTSMEIGDSGAKEATRKDYIECMWSISNCPSFQKGRIQIELIPAYNKPGQEE